MSGATAPLRVAVPDVAAARALAEVWSGSAGLAASWQVVTPEAAEAALRAGHVDLAFVPTLAVLRDPDAFSVVPGVALVGKAYRPTRLHLPNGLEVLARGRPLQVGVDPRLQQEALLARVIVVEHYGVQPQFVPFQGEPPAGLDAVLLAAEEPQPAEGVTLDLGREWFELTTRPMVWALLAAVPGGVDVEEARFLRDSTLEATGTPDEPGTEEPASVTLGAYAHAGLDEWVRYLFFVGAIGDMPGVPFVTIPDGTGDDPGMSDNGDERLD